jgi:hypothetical protein
VNDEYQLFAIRGLPKGSYGSDGDVRCFVTGIREDIDDTTILGNEDGIGAGDASVGVRIEFTTVA